MEKEILMAALEQSLPLAASIGDGYRGSPAIERCRPPVSRLCASFKLNI
jgi:hypothetical protein